MKYHVEDLMEDQRAAEDGLFELEHEQGMWAHIRENALYEQMHIKASASKEGRSPSDDELAEMQAYADEYVKDKMDAKKELDDRLKPVRLDKMKLPQILLVRYKENPHYPESPFDAKKTYICLGEVAQMPGHVVIADFRTGEIFAGYHSADFEVIPVTHA